MKNKNKGEAKASPRPDPTRNTRQAKRRAKLNEIARLAGFTSWSDFETKVINSIVRIIK